jgi:hypothetical protein
MRVCCEDFPKGSRPRQKEDGFYMEDILKTNLDLLIKNIKDDWDFTILISGGGNVRMGKSVLAQQIAYYIWSEIKRLYGHDNPFNLQDNYSFRGSEHIKKGKALGENYPYSLLIFDEAGSDLESRKVMTKQTRELLDFFRECGQYNLFHILVLPDFFELPKGIAMTRSTCLIDVFTSSDEEGKFVRGYYNFYNKQNKKMLFLKGKKYLDYKAHPYNFHGKFTNFYPLPEAEYRQMKRDALAGRERTAKEQSREFKYLKQRDIAFAKLHELGMSYQEISDYFKLNGISITHQGVNDAVLHLADSEDIELLNAVEENKEIKP